MIKTIAFQHLHRLHKHGFSLVETAIILGVIGIVAGGIWVAASAVSKRVMANDTLAIISLSDQIYAETQEFSSDSSFVNDFIKNYTGRILPGGYTLDVSGYQILAPWGAFSPYYVVGSPNRREVIFSFYNGADDSNRVSRPELCAAIISYYAKKKFDVVWGFITLVKIGTGELYGWDPNNPPATASDYSAACKDTDLITISGFTN